MLEESERLLAEDPVLNKATLVREIPEETIHCGNLTTDCKVSPEGGQAPLHFSYSQVSQLGSTGLITLQGWTTRILRLAVPSGLASTG